MYLLIYIEVHVYSSHITGRSSVLVSRLGNMNTTIKSPNVSMALMQYMRRGKALFVLGILRYMYMSIKMPSSRAMMLMTNGSLIRGFSVFGLSNLVRG